LITVLESNKAVSVPAQILISALIPFAGFWAAYRIKKLRMFVVLFIALIAFNIFIGNNIIGVLIPFPFSLPVILAVNMALIIYYIRKWSIEWNNKVSSRP
jgi:hypothetical protein